MKVSSTVFDRLLKDSVKKRQRRIYTAKFDRQPREGMEWQKRLSASNLLTIPTISRAERPLSTASSSLANRPNTTSSIGNIRTTKSENDSNDFDIHFSAKNHFSSFPGHVKHETCHKKLESTTCPIIAVPKQIKSRTISFEKTSVLMESVTGVPSFPLPPVVVAKKQEMVSCRSSLVAFYDKQGTY